MGGRAGIRVGGDDREGFLQDLVTNDVRRAAEGPVYAALLTPQGKFLADFFVVAQGDTILIDAPEAAAPGLLQRLTMYRLRRKVTLEASPLSVTAGLGDAPGGALPDPRLGGAWRHYGAEGPGELPDEVRVAHLIPAYGAELVPNESYVLEQGFERLEGVDFRKGCYVGQEIVARMKHKTELRKGLARLALGAPAAPGDAVTDARGREAGRITTVAGRRALAMLRYDRDGPTVNGAPATREA
ncbi:MAG: CAF17-like 4Fe-4S cluster assembly/insertion protein YgfZ [Hasllibacter sp.]